MSCKPGRSIPPSRKRIRVVLGDDQAPIRSGVRAALESDGFEVCGEADDAPGTVEAVLRERPDVCLLGVRIPGNGIAAAARIHREAPEVAVVMLSASREERDVFDALRAGASGYLLKGMDPTRLSVALRGVLDGEAALPRVLTARLIEEFRGDRRDFTRLAGPRVVLTDREREVLGPLVEGRSSAEIAERLGVSPVTVRRHVSGLMRKFEAEDREVLVKLVNGRLEQ